MKHYLSYGGFHGGCKAGNCPRIFVGETDVVIRGFILSKEERKNFTPDAHEEVVRIPRELLEGVLEIINNEPK